MLIMTLKIVVVVVMVLGAYLFFSDIIHSMFRKKPTEVALLDDLDEKDGIPVVPRHLRKHIHNDENADVDNEETEEKTTTDDADNKEVKNLKTIAQSQQNKAVTEEINDGSADDKVEEAELNSSLFATEFDEEVKKSLQKDMELLNNVDSQFDTKFSSIEETEAEDTQQEEIAETITEEVQQLEEITEETQVSDEQSTSSPYANPFQVGSSNTELHYSSAYAVQQNVANTAKLEPHNPLLEQSLNDNHKPEQDSPLTNASDNLNIVILPTDESRLISGDKLLQIINDFGFKFGTMNMLHRYQNKDGSGILWFSMMGLTKEGVITFDLNTLPTIEDLKGLVMFLPLPHPNVLQGFDSMMSISGLICREIGGYIIDEYGDEITPAYKKELRNLLQSTLIEDE